MKDRGTQALHRATQRTTTQRGARGDQQEGSRLLLVARDQRLREDIALIAAVVGIRLEVCSHWGELQADVDQTRLEGAVAVICSADSLPPTGRLAERALLAGHDLDTLWAAAAQMPGLTPVPLPQGERWLSEHLSARLLDRSQGRVLAVTGAQGGVGASTFAYLCAAELAVRGAAPLLADAAAGSLSGLADLLGASRRRRSVSGGELDWAQLSRTEGELSSAHLHSGVPILDGVGILTGCVETARLPAVLSAAVLAGRRAFDVVVIDVGQRTELLHSLGEQIDELLVVTRASRRGADSAAAVLRAAPQSGQKIVVNGRAAGFGAADIEESLGAPVIADLAEQRWLTRSEDIGESYELLRSRRGAGLIAGILDAVGVEDA